MSDGRPDNRIECLADDLFVGPTVMSDGRPDSGIESPADELFVGRSVELNGLMLIRVAEMQSWS